MPVKIAVSILRRLSALVYLETENQLVIDDEHIIVLAVAIELDRRYPQIGIYRADALQQKGLFVHRAPGTGMGCQKLET